MKTKTQIWDYDNKGTKDRYISWKCNTEGCSNNGSTWVRDSSVEDLPEDQKKCDKCNK